MPRLGVDALRWLLLLVNIAALGGAGFLGQRLVRHGMEDQIRRELPDPSEFAIPEEVEQVFDSRQVNRIQGLWKREKPKPPPPREPVDPTPLPDVIDGGPLSDWEIAYVVIPPNGGPRSASIQEKQAESVLPGAGARTPTASTRGRNVPNNRRRTVRRSPRRVAAPQQQVGRAKYVREGVPFRIGDNWFTPTRITAVPDEEMAFKDEAGREFVIVRESFPETAGISKEDGMLVLVGQSPEDLLDENAPGQPAQPAVPDDRRGSIQRSGNTATPQPQRTTPNRRQPATSQTDPRRSPAAERRAESDREREAAKEAIKRAGESADMTPEQKKELLKAGRALDDSRGGRDDR